MKKKTPVFSIGIIFKNEIRCLERCLKSLQPLRDAIACEVVMADTGSTDGSREIAEKYADILFDFEWVDDFAAARNAVMDRCSGTWYLSIDADEWLAEDIKELLQFARMKKIVLNYGTVMMRNYKTADLDKSGHFVDFTAIRLARLSTGTRYTGRIHEKWLGPKGEGVRVLRLENTWLYHDGYAFFSKESAVAKHDRNMALLKKKLEEDPTDLQTYIECIDSSKHTDKESADYARQALKVFWADQKRWGLYGGVVYRGVVSVAEFHKLPELEEWIAQAQEYSHSIFVNVDVAFYAFSHYYEKENGGDYEETVRWGEIYRKGLAEYRAGNYDHNELIRGVVECMSPFWERKVLIPLAECHLSRGEYEEAYALLCELVDVPLDADQTRFFTLIALRLHREAMLDTPALITRLWARFKKTDEKEPGENELLDEPCRASFLQVAFETFTPKYRREELKKEKFLRHSYTVFITLDDDEMLGMSAVIMEMEDSKMLEDLLSQVEPLKELSIHALAHALKCGVPFPIPNRPLNVEEMDGFAARLSKEKEVILPLAEQAAQGDFVGNWQNLLWARGLVIAAVRAFDWKAGKLDKKGLVTQDLEGESPEDIETQGLALARAFAQVEGKYLPLCYTSEVLQEKNMFVLPPMHRLGWYCAQAFAALDAGDSVGCVRLLRSGLEICRDRKDMVEFLIDHMPELQVSPTPSEELKALADQIRTVLANFSPDDPAVVALKASDAYQKVITLIEGASVPIIGGLAQ